METENMTPGETLSLAAEVMRERAAATSRARRQCSPEKHGGPLATYSPVFIENAFASHAPGESDDPELRAIWRADAEHLDGWQPASVALAVADWLDCANEWSASDEPEYEAALAVARAFLQ